MNVNGFATTTAYHEQVLVFPMGAVLEERYRAFQQTITEQALQLLNEGDSSALVPWFLTLLRFPDQPWLPWTCRTQRGFVLGEVPAVLSEDIPTELEAGLLTYVATQYRLGFSVLIFTENNDHDHLKKILTERVRGESDQVPRVEVLTRDLHPLNRAAWLWCRREEGLDILVANPGLVAGLDMRFFPRIIYKRPPLNWSQLLQSMRCSYRPGQQHPVEVVLCLNQDSLALSWFLKMVVGEREPTENALANLIRETWEMYQQVPLSGASETQAISH